MIGAGHGDAGAARRTVAGFDRLAARWDVEHGPASTRADAFAAHVDYLRAHCARLGGPRVLDIGCGTGQHLLALAPWIGAGVGIDISERMVERAAENARVGQYRTLDFVQAAAEELTRERFGRFDLVLFVGALEHLASPAVGLRMARDLLQPAGRIVVIMPHWLKPALWHPIRWLLGGHGQPPVRHLSLPSLRSVAAGEGLVVDQSVALPHGIDLLRPFGVHGARLFAGRWARAAAVLRGAFGASLRCDADLPRLRPGSAPHLPQSIAT